MLITAKQAVKQLKEEVGVVISQQRFGKLKQLGIFKVHRKQGSRKDWFVFDEVLEAYLVNVIPKTEEQHKVRSDYYSLKSDEAVTIPNPEHFSLDDFQLPDCIRDEFLSDIEAANSVNDSLKFFAYDILNMVSSHNREIIAELENSYIDRKTMDEVLEAKIKDAAEDSKCKDL